MLQYEKLLCLIQINRNKEKRKDGILQRKKKERRMEN
jgi:hypothetical protein